MCKPYRVFQTRVVIALLLGLGGLCAAIPAGAAEDSGFVCQVTSSEKVELAPEVPGVIDKILVQRGDHVIAGQPVAELRDHLQRVVLDLAAARAADTSILRARRAKLAYANRKLARNAGLMRGNMISANDIDQIRTERDVAADDVTAAIEAQKQAELELEKARVELAMRTIRSPVTGVVTERLLAPGDLAREQPILVVQQVDPLFVEITLPIGMMGKVRAGTVAHVAIEVPGTPHVTAPVTQVDPVIDPASNTFLARIVLPNPKDAIPAGSKCNVRFDLP